MLNKTNEFWYDLKKQNAVLRFLLVGTFIMFVFTFFVASSQMNRKPFVIRVASNGETSIIDDASPYAQADGQEAKYFAQQFLNLYLTPNSDSITKDLSLALSWMVPNLQAEHAASYSKTSYIEQVKTQHVKSELFLNSLASSPEGDGFFVISKGIVQTYHKDSNTLKKRDFEARIELTQTSRTAYNPQGLLVSNIDVVYQDEPVYNRNSAQNDQAENEKDEFNVEIQ